MPTASAVWSDLIEIARRLAAGQGALPQDVPLWTGTSLALRPMEAIRSSYYLRVSALDKPGVLSQVAGILGQHEISIASVIQKGRAAVRAVPVVMMTHEALERDMRRALLEIDRLSVVADRTVMIRVEEPP
jgi:homoserine dehydrogenase